MTTPSIQTLFWDLGGVILSNGWDKTQRTRVLGPLGVNLPAYEAAHEQHNWYWERGLLSARTFFDRTVLSPNPGLELSPGVPLTFNNLWPLVCAESSLDFPATLDLLRSLRTLPGLRCATLNNESAELNAYRLDTFHLRPLFHFFLCSGYLHEMKPAAGIFRDAVHISGHPAATALFIDDKPENCDAARAQGMHAIDFESPAQLRSELEHYGIQLPE